MKVETFHSLHRQNNTFLYGCFNWPHQISIEIQTILNSVMFSCPFKGVNSLHLT